MPEKIALHMVYLAHALRGLALVVGAYFFVLGVRLLSKGQPDHQSGDIKGTWGNFTIAFKNTPAGSVALVMGTLVVASVILKAEPKFSSTDPYGGMITVQSQAVLSRPMLTDEDQTILNRIETSAGQLVPGRTLDGRLTENEPQLSRGNRFSVWEFVAEQGQSLTIDATSNAFDTKLFIIGPAMEEPLIDDDSGEGNNSRISFVPPANDKYKAIVSAYEREGLGDYKISLRNE